MEFTLIKLTIGCLLFATLVAYVLTKIPNRYYFKWATIPAVFALSLYMGLTIPDLLGYAYPGHPHGTFTYVSHHIDNQGKVFLLAISHGKVRLYEFAGSPDTDGALAKAQEMTQQGQTVTGKFKTKSKFGFPGLFDSDSPIEIKAPNNYGMLPPKTETQPQQQN